METVALAVPPGAVPGQSISFIASDGRKVSLVVPPGVVPGQQLQVNIPASVPNDDGNLGLMADDAEPHDLTEQLFDALSSADVKCTYSFGGELENVPLPGLHVENVGRIALPLMEEQAAKLHAVSEVAPFGRGSETVVDETVRKARQIDAAQVQLSANWNAAIERAVLEHLEHLELNRHIDVCRIRGISTGLLEPPAPR